MYREAAIAQALEWASRAEVAAKEFPHIPSSEHARIDSATRMAEMWTKLAEGLDIAPVKANW